MTSDPYEALGVKKDVAQGVLQKTYRRLAKKFHPDLNPGDAKAEQKFKIITAAYDLLSDPDKRARFDRGEIDASGAERPRQPYYRDFAEADGGSQPYHSDAGFADFADLSDDSGIFSAIFNRRGASKHRVSASDAHYGLDVDFLDAINGTKRTVKLENGSQIEITIPPGTNQGQVLRLRGKGPLSTGGAEPGDALVTVSILPHPYFTRKNADIYLDLPITLGEAVLGGKMDVPTPAGLIRMTVPRNVDTERVFRLKGKGAPRRGLTRGDTYVRLKLVLPVHPDAELEKFVSTWHPVPSDNPRRHLEK